MWLAISLPYPDFNKLLEIHIDDRNLQLEYIIIQEGKTIDFCIIKLIETQKHYTITEKEMLSIFEILKEF